MVVGSKRVRAEASDNGDDDDYDIQRKNMPSFSLFLSKLTL